LENKPLSSSRIAKSKTLNYIENFYFYQISSRGTGGLDYQSKWNKKPAIIKKLPQRVVIYSESNFHCFFLLVELGG